MKVIIRIIEKELIDVRILDIIQLKHNKRGVK
jgi:hypothetical protein